MIGLACRINAPYETHHAPFDRLPTHRHRAAYATLVLSGTYVEVSADGPVECGPGTLILHPHFHAHADRFADLPVRTLNVVLPDNRSPASLQSCTVTDRKLARELLMDAPQAVDTLVAAARAAELPPVSEWQRAFSAELRETDAPVGAIARRLGVSPAHASRAICHTFGMTPRTLRREWRWQRALQLLRGVTPLAHVAASAGFADQSHLARVCKRYTGMTLLALRRYIKFVQ